MFADDTVYVEDDKWRKEYVEDDVGLIWRGTHSRHRPMSWHFGQYDKDILKCILYILTKTCHVIPAHRADPIKTSRAMSAGVCYFI